MTRSLRLLAPAKINWTLEVLRIRPDGYHEIRSVLQTLGLCDVVTLADAGDISLELNGAAGKLLDEPPERNLAYRAAVAMRDITGVRRGVRIRLEKRIPVAAGLGGGSSDAAAVLRGLNVLWGAAQPEINLVEIAGEIGSDPPFFVVGGTALASGRGDAVEPLDDAVAPPILIAAPPEGQRDEKTASMYAALSPDDYSDGDATIGVRETVEAGRMILDEELYNVFERVASSMQPETEKAMDALRAQGHTPHLCGSGPSFFLLHEEPQRSVLSDRIRELGFEPIAVRTMSRAAALRIEG